jgi:protein TonB
MEAQKILSSSLLDILYEGRNKAYGSYELRKNFHKRLLISLLSVLGLTLIIFLLLFILNKDEDNSGKKEKSIDVTLTDIKKDEVKITEPPPPPPPPPPPEPPKKIDMQKLSTIVLKDEVKEEQAMAENKDIKNSGTDNQEGAEDIADEPKPTEEPGNDIVENKPVEITFLDPSNEAQYKGDWSAYISKTINRSLDDLVEEGQAGTCEVLFTVSEDGSVSEVEALTMKGTLFARICVDAIKKGGDWKPGRNALGNPVPSKRIQKVKFVIPDE